MKLRIMLFSVLMLFVVSCVTTAQDGAARSESAAVQDDTKPESATVQNDARPESDAVQDDAKPESASAGWSESQIYSYIIGTQISNFSKQSELEVNLELFAKGLDDMTKGGELALSQAEINNFMAILQKKAQEKAQAEMKVIGAVNAGNGRDFLAANKEKEGVKVTGSGLQYKVITEGDGARPAATDKVKVHYSGALISGKEFDSSYKRKKPAEFRLDQVIKGWAEGVQLMSVGSKYELYVPTELAYGPKAPAGIGPNQTLNFTVELLEIIAQDAPEE